MDYFLNIPNKVYGLLMELERAGYEAYVVGGCVRDVLMGRTPADWDITTSAEPSEVEEVFSGERLVETGLKHGTVTVVKGAENFEITTFRKDGPYSDGRHPDSVSFGKDIKEDLARRDFTMNALAYSPSKGLVDEYGGIDDINGGVIRCVGDPDKRFAEDVLRVMRAIRFSGTLGSADPGTPVEEAKAGDGDAGSADDAGKAAGDSGKADARKKAVSAADGQLGFFTVLFGAGGAAGFEPDKDTLKAIRQHAGEVNKASRERISTELTKLVMGRFAAHAIWKFRHELDVILAPAGLKTADKKSITALTYAPGDLALRLAIAFGPSREGAGETSEKEAFRKALTELKFDSATIKRAGTIKEISKSAVAPEDPVIRLEMRKLSGEYPDEEVPDVLADGISVRALKGEMPDKDTEQAFGIIADIMESGRCFSLSGLEVDGKALIGEGIPEGPEVGKILSALLDEVIAGETRNEKEALLVRASELKELFGI